MNYFKKALKILNTHKSIKTRITRFLLKQEVLSGRPLKIIVGSDNSLFKGWFSTDQDVLNLLNQEHWKKYFSPFSIDAILAEHVWEHLTAAEGLTAAKNCYSYLKEDGYLRVAVPDGFHPNPEYIDMVDVGGKDDHKVLYNYKSFKNVFESAGFKVNLLEYFDEEGEFHFEEWNIEDGYVKRSKKYDSRNKDGKLNFTSIILDAYKI
jgi:predicted SAM-dependent methyltransferase